jgi:hypothetical protein
MHGRVEQPEPKACAWPGCANAGEFRAPLSNKVPGDVGGWQYFCLDHVRAFNAGYNFFDGMAPDEIMAAQSPLAGWVRDTVRGGREAFTFGDPHGLFSAATGPAGGGAVPSPHAGGRWAAPGDARALGVLGLDRTATPADIRRAYRQAVRRYHPDSNGGDRRHEGTLQAVVNAFTHLKAAAGYKTEQTGT